MNWHIVRPYSCSRFLPYWSFVRILYSPHPKKKEDIRFHGTKQLHCRHHIKATITTAYTIYDNFQIKYYIPEISWQLTVLLDVCALLRLSRVYVFFCYSLNFIHLPHSREGGSNIFTLAIQHLTIILFILRFFILVAQKYWEK